MSIIEMKETSNNFQKQLLTKPIDTTDEEPGNSTESDQLMISSGGVPNVVDVQIILKNQKNDHHKYKQITYCWNNINVWSGSRNIPKPSLSNTNLFTKRKKFNFFKVEKKHILKNVSGILRPGELVAVLGASGAGKTTLLDILSFRNSHKLKVSGTRTINGVLVERNTITSISAYVQQIDLFFGVLTVREHLVFQALVRMHDHIPQKQRMARVEEVIQEFGLLDCANTRIGTRWIKGISGGEMKRLAIATEILTDPMFMCCDEPTSGLDSSTAQQVMLVLKELASKGKTVVCTVHQPSSQIFALFDKIILMAKGRVAFLGSGVEAIQFFSKLGFVCPVMYSPSDFLIDTLAIKNGEEINNLETINKICDAFSEDITATEVVDVDNLDLITNQNKQNKISTHSRYKASWWIQFCTVLKRSWITYVRDPTILRLRFAQTLILSLFLGTIFFQLDLGDYSGIQNLNGSIFMILTSLSYQYVFGILDCFCSELPVFLREHWNGMYRTDIYFLSKLIVEIPFNIFFPIVFTSIFYFMIGYDQDVKSFLYTVLIVILLTNTFCAIGYLMSCLATTITVALILCPVILFPFLLFGGFLLRPGTGPIYLIWIEKISFFFYGSEVLSIVQLEHITNIKCPNLNGTCPNDGIIVLHGLGFDKDNFQQDLIAISGLTVAIQILAYLTLLERTIRP